MAVFLCGCTGGGKTLARQSDTENSAETLVYECANGYGFTARLAGESAWLFLPGETVNLPARHSGKGRLFEDNGYSFLVARNRMELHTPDRSVEGCKRDRMREVWEDAKLRGVDFRAAGNEPGWHLEIGLGKSLLFVTDYGQARYRFTVSEGPEVDRAARQTRYRAEADGHRIEVLISYGECSDTMSGARFESRVQVDLDGRVVTGCGMALH